MAEPGSFNPQESKKPSGLAWWKQLGAKLLLLGGTLLVLALVLEAGTRLFTDIVPPLIVKDPVLGKRYQRSIQVAVYVPEARRKIPIRFNDVGFRGPDRPFAKPDGVRRVAFLGDSMIASLGVDEQDTLVHRLQEMLNESAPDVTWEVLNFGVAGASPGQEIALYRGLVSRYETDIVLCGYYVGNDLADNCNRLSHNPRIYFDFDDDGNYRQLHFAVTQAWISQFLNRYSRFYVWQKTLSLRARDVAREALQMFQPGAWIYCKQGPEKVEYAWKLTEAAIETLNREVVDRSGRFALVIIPASEQVYTDRLEKIAAIDENYSDQFDWDHPDRRLGEICSKLGLPFLSMTGDFRAAAPSASSSVEEEWLFH